MRKEPIKRLLAMALAVVCTVGLTSTAWAIDQPPVNSATSACVMDVDSGRILYSKNENVERCIASITKIMTAILVIENNTDFNQVITASKTAAAEDGTSLYLVEGDKLTLMTGLYGTMLRSGNDAAVAIAEHTAGSVEKFVQMMNDKAAQMGLENTRFQNPHGLDEGLADDEHYSSAADISVMVRYAMQDPTFREVVGMKSCTLDLSGEPRELLTTNALLATWDDCIGVKTGFTNKAGQCLAAAASRDGVELYAIVLDSSDEVQRFIDAYKLLDWGFTHYRPYTLATPDQVLVDAPMSGFLDKTVKAGVAEEVTGMVFDFNGDIAIDVRLTDRPDGVAKGDTVGTITWRQGENIVASVPLVALEDKMGPSPVTSVITSLVRCVGIVTGDQCVAQSTVYVQAPEVERVQSTAGQGMNAALEMEIRDYIAAYNASVYGSGS